MSSFDRNAAKSHFCGLCNELSSSYGFGFRALTNHDAAYYSILYSAQSGEKLEQQKCPFRFGRSKHTSNPGLEYAGAISILMAKTKIDDDLHDENSFFHRVLSKLVDSKFPLAEETLARFGFNLKFVSSQIQRQQTLEKQNCSDLDELSGPTKNVVSEIFAHTATLSGAEANMRPLTIIGKYIGKLMYLLDSYIDMPSDMAKGRFNALQSCFGQENATLMRKRVGSISSQSMSEISRSVKNLKLHSHKRILNDALLTSLNQRLETLLAPKENRLQDRMRNSSLLLGAVFEDSIPIYWGPNRCICTMDPGCCLHDCAYCPH
jgi:hypothetical protein